jgi:ABC-type lipoprotein release transport system permease subunit
MKGFQQRIISLGTQTMAGEAEIHLKDYLKTKEPSLYINNAANRMNTIKAIPGVAAMTPRLFNTALAAMGDRAISVEVLGVDPQTEPLISNWKSRIWRGAYLYKHGQAMLGKKLAEKLELNTGGKLVLTVADLKTGELNSQLFKVTGIIWSQNPQLNEHMAIISLNDAWALSGVRDAVHEFALKFTDPVERPEDIHPALDPEIPSDLELSDWHELLPQVTFMLKFQSFFLGFAFIVIIFLVALGMINTMSMSILERIREFGVLQALGTLPGMMIRMVLYEFIAMGILGTLLGLLLGWLLTAWLSAHGIAVDQVEVTGFIMTDPIIPLMDWPRALGYSFLFCLFIPVFSILPIRRITQLDTVRALRFS